MAKDFRVSKTHEHTISYGFTNEQIAGLLCSALEGGSNRWYMIEEVIDPTSWEFKDSLSAGEGKHWYHEYPLNPGGALLISDQNEEEKKTFRLDAESIQKGLELLSETHLNDILNEDADATTGDEFLQCCLFGEVVYA